MFTIKKNDKNVWELYADGDKIHEGSAHLILLNLKAYMGDEDYFDNPQDQDLELSGLEELDFDHSEE